METAKAFNLDQEPVDCEGVQGPLFCTDPSETKDGKAFHVADADKVASLRYTGWYADANQMEVYSGQVWAVDTETDCTCDTTDEDSEGYCSDCGDHYGCEECETCPNGTRTFYAVVVSSDTDSVWIEPDTYSEDVEAAKRADRLAELLAEKEREYSEAGDAGQTARRMLQDANDDIRQAFEHIRAAVASFPCAPDSSALHLETALDLLYQGKRARIEAFEYGNENRPLGRFPWTARLVEAYREGWSSNI